MSGSESLTPYIRDVNDAEYPTIVVDSREASSAPKIIKGLREHGAEIKIQVLEKGDYILSEQCAFERKTVNDFVYTLTRRYLFEQVFLLKEAYVKPFILIEGYLPVIYKFSKINPSSVWGAMFALAKGGINMIQTTNWQETVDFLYISARQEQLVEKRPMCSPFKIPIRRSECASRLTLWLSSSKVHLWPSKATAAICGYFLTFSKRKSERFTRLSIALRFENNHRPRPEDVV